MNKRGLRIFRFNMIEIALALVVLAVGLSSVLVLFPIGANAGKQSVTDNNLANVAEQLAAYFQANCTAPNTWKSDGSAGVGTELSAFAAEPDDTSVPTDDTGFNEETYHIGGETYHTGLFKKDNSTYIYRQYTAITDPSDSNKTVNTVDFEVMVRVGLDTDSLLQQYYPLATSASETGVADGKWKKLADYTRTGGDVTKPTGTLMNTGISDILKKCCKTLVVEFSWPVDAEWSKREKRIFRLEMFNENFVPYPQTP